MSIRACLTTNGQGPELPGPSLPLPTQSQFPSFSSRSLKPHIDSTACHISHSNRCNFTLICSVSLPLTLFGSFRFSNPMTVSLSFPSSTLLPYWTPLSAIECTFLMIRLWNLHQVNGFRVFKCFFFTVLTFSQVMLFSDLLLLHSMTKKLSYLTIQSQVGS